MTDAICVSNLATRAPRRVSIFARLAFWRDLRRQRLALSRLDDRQLQDIGLTRADVVRELARPMWDAPPHWFDADAGR